MTNNFQPKGAGLGLRRPHIPELMEKQPGAIDFFELAPENWLGVGGKRAEELAFFKNNYPLICHGLSLSIGSPTSLDMDFLKQLKDFLNTHEIAIYSEHLSYCSAKGQLYDLLPIPFTEEAVHYVAKRINQVQECLQRRLIMENISYYMVPDPQMSEAEFINAVLKEAQCDLLLDVNNIYVNSNNHGYDAKEFIRQVQQNKIAYIHVAGHYQQDDLIIDTHGENIIDPVWDLLSYTYQQCGVIPTIVERDSNLPSLDYMLQEVNHVKTLQQQESNHDS